MMTLWTIFRSPMFFGGELRSSDASTISLLTNPMLTEMHQNITKSYPVENAVKGLVEWFAHGKDANYRAYFNLNFYNIKVTLPKDGLSGWTNKEHVQDEIAIVPAHGVLLLKESM